MGVGVGGRKPRLTGCSVRPHDPRIHSPSPRGLEGVQALRSPGGLTALISTFHKGGRRRWQLSSLPRVLGQGREPRRELTRPTGTACGTALTRSHR